MEEYTTTVLLSPGELRRRQEAEARARRRSRLTAICALLLALSAGAAFGASVVEARGGFTEPPPAGDGAAQSSGLPSGTVGGGVPAPELPDWITEDLLPVNEYSRPGTPLTEVKGVVVHYVGNPDTTAWQNKNYFKNLAETHATYASSNLIVGLDGEVILCVPLDEIAYCSTVRNKDTISIEVCHPDETGKFSDTTMDSLIRLLRFLCVHYGLEREDILRHYDADGKECPMWYVKNPGDWEALRDRVFEDLNDY